jgi:hypothetical protein
MSSTEVWPDGEFPEDPEQEDRPRGKAARPNGAGDGGPAGLVQQQAGFGSQATRIEALRAAAEVAAQVQAAQMVPRTMRRAISGLRQSCGQPTFADKAFYRYPRGQTSDGRTNYITGISVYLARELARLFGNCQYGIAELSRDDNAGMSEMNAWAWDVESNTRSSISVLVPHIRYKTGNRKTGPIREPLIDPRDIYENNANNAARRLRQMILAILPPWYVAMAEDLCRDTIAGVGAEKDGVPVPLEVRLSDAADGFSNRWGVRLDQLEAKLGAPFAKWVQQDLATLRILFRSIAGGETTVEDEFAPAAAVTDAELAAQAAARAPQAPPAKPARAAGLPAEETVTVPAEHAGDGTVPAPDDGQACSDQTRQQIETLFATCGWAGPPNQGRRLAVTGYAAAEGAGLAEPLRPASWDEVTEAQARTAAAWMQAFVDKTPAAQRRDKLRTIHTALTVSGASAPAGDVPPPDEPPGR